MAQIGQSRPDSGFGLKAKVHKTSEGVPSSRRPPGFQMESLISYKLGPKKFTAENNLYLSYQSKRVVILIETKFVNYEGFHMGLLGDTRRGS